MLRGNVRAGVCFAISLLTPSIALADGAVSGALGELYFWVALIALAVLALTALVLNSLRRKVSPVMRLIGQAAAIVCAGLFLVAARRSHQPMAAHLKWLAIAALYLIAWAISIHRGRRQAETEIENR